jgi:FMN hydrolase / 5-amino-6-(5-phospho-D-ribitylamino)uracil phosphatase
LILSTERSRIRAVAFDLDETLWPITPVILGAEAAMRTWITEHAPQALPQFSREAMQARRARMLEKDPSIEHDVRRLRLASIHEGFAEAGLSADIADAAFEVFKHARNQVACFDDAEPALKRLKPHYRLASISNGFADLEAIGMAHWFEVSIAAHEIGVAKPDIEIYLACARRLKLEPAEILYIGDDPLNDVIGPRVAGMQSIWLSRSARALMIKGFGPIA